MIYLTIIQSTKKNLERVQRPTDPPTSQNVQLRPAQLDLSQIFARNMHDFDPIYDYILVVSPGIINASIDPAAFLPLSRIPWRGIIDLDPLSDTKHGLCHLLQKALMKQLDTPVIKLAPKDVVNLESDGIPWLFARGIDGDLNSLCRSYREYNRKGRMYDILTAISSKDSFECVFLMMIFDDSHDVIKIFEDITSKIDGTLSSRASIVTICGENIQMHLLSSLWDTLVYFEFQEPVQFDTLKLLSHIDTVVTKRFGNSKEKKDYVLVGGQSISRELFATLSIEWELVYQDIGEASRDENYSPMDFYMGRRDISWTDLSQDKDIRRTIYNSIKSKIEKGLQSSKHMITNIKHDPGAGGTTLARRLAYDLRESYPCLILKSDQNLDQSEKMCVPLKMLFNAVGGRSLLLIVHVEQEKIRSFEFDLRYSDVKFVIIRVGHSHSSFLTEIEKEKKEKLGNVLDRTEALRFYQRFKEITVPGTVNEESNSDDDKGDRQGLKDPFTEQYGYTEQQFKEKYSTEEKTSNNKNIVNNMVMFTPIYFALTKFQKGFQGLEPFVAKTLKQIGDKGSPSRVIIALIAFAHRYGQSGRYPSTQILARYVGEPQTKTLENLISSASCMLISHPRNRSGWRTIHYTVASEILRQHCTSNMKKDLFELAKTFAQCCRPEHHSNILPNDIRSLIKGIYFERGGIKLIGEEEKEDKAHYSEIIMVLAPEKEETAVDYRRQLFEGLVEWLPDAYCYAHLARFWMNELSDKYQEALQIIDQALEIQKDDGNFLHMRGMIHRHELYREIERLGTSTAEKAKNEDRLMFLAHSATKSFCDCRARGNAHGFVSEIGMLLRLINFVEKRESRNYLDIVNYRKEVTNEDMKGLLNRVQDLVCNMAAEGSGGNFLDAFEKKIRKIHISKQSQILQAFEVLCKQGIRELERDHSVDYRSLLHYVLSESEAGNDYKPPDKNRSSWKRMRGHPNVVFRWAIKYLKESIDGFPAYLVERDRVDNVNAIFRYWIRGVRYTINGNQPPYLIEALCTVERWYTLTECYDALYYRFILSFLLSMYENNRNKARRYAENAEKYRAMCFEKVKETQNRTPYFESLGCGTPADLKVLRAGKGALSLAVLVHSTDMDFRKDSDGKKIFDRSALFRVGEGEQMPGIISSTSNNQRSGRLSHGYLEGIYVGPGHWFGRSSDTPTVDLSLNPHYNDRVTFKLGFTYREARAFEVQLRD